MVLTQGGFYVIEFTGEVKEYSLKKSVRIMQRFVLICGLASLPGSIFFILMFHKLYILAFPGILFLMSIIPCITYKNYIKFLPEKIRIENNMVIGFFRNVPQSIDINQIKKVYDFGEYYDIISTNFIQNHVFVCQKSLLSKGSIEEFESIFDGKIVRKNDRGWL